MCKQKNNTKMQIEVYVFFGLVVSNKTKTEIESHDRLCEVYFRFTCFSQRVFTPSVC